MFTMRKSNIHSNGQLVYFFKIQHAGDFYGNIYIENLIRSVKSANKVH